VDQTISSIVTAFGVGIAARQLYLTQVQNRSSKIRKRPVDPVDGSADAYEDSFAEQYREISAQIPLDTLLGKPLSEAELNVSLRAFYEYFDLSNEQAFLASHGRVRSETWTNWREGIEQHLNRPAFNKRGHI
jgi:hypothetical protein